MKKIALVDCRSDRRYTDRLHALGYRTVGLPPYSKLSPPVASHPDLLFFRYRDTVVCRREYLEEHPELSVLVSELSENYRVVLSDSSATPDYPGEVGLCALPLGKRILCRARYATHEIFSLAETLDVPQGYAACSCISLEPDRLITADAGIARIARREGITVLEISCGGVTLPPYEYGFIGGASGVDGDAVYFFGDPMSHPDGEAICRFITESGRRAVSLGEGGLEDFGKILFI